MSARSSVAVAVVAAVSAAGCGGADHTTPSPPARSGPALETRDYVATPTLGDGSSQRLFDLTGLGRFRATCTRAGRAAIVYKAAQGSATQRVTTENGGFTSNSRVDPGQRMAVALGRPAGPRVEWQIALLSAGRVEVATAAFTVGPLAGTHGCLVSGKAEVAERQR